MLALSARVEPGVERRTLKEHARRSARDGVRGPESRRSRRSSGTRCLSLRARSRFSWDTLTMVGARRGRVKHDDTGRHRLRIPLARP